MSKYSPGIFGKKLKESLFKQRMRYNRPRFGRIINQKTVCRFGYVYFLGVLKGVAKEIFY